MHTSKDEAAWALFDLMTRRRLFMRTYGFDLSVGPVDRLDDTIRALIDQCKPELWRAAKTAEMLIERVRRPRLK